MEYREIEAINLDEAKIKIRKEYGERARIIKVTESSKGGVFGIGSKKFVKVLISVSDFDLLKKYKENLGITSLNKKNILKEKPGETGDLQEIINKDLSLNSMNLLFEKLNSIEKAISKNSDTADDLLHVNISEVKLILKENEFSDEFIDSLVESIKENLPYSKIENRLEVHKFVYDYIKEKIIIADGISRNNNKKNIMVLVGPTGVGKTTTIAKIAANAIREKLRLN
jgi:flagellar biosynthesis protein FlhF